MAIVKRESRISFGLDWYDSEKEAEDIANYENPNGIKRNRRAPEFDCVVNGKKAFAVKVP